MATLPMDGLRELPHVVVRSRGVAGEVDVEARDDGGTDRGWAEDLPDLLTRTGIPAEGVRAFADAVAETSLQRRLDVTLDRLDAPPPPGPLRRSIDEDVPTLELEVAEAPPGQAQVMLEIDDTGVVAWHLPLPLAPTDTRRGLPTQTFRIPVVQAAIPGREPPGAPSGADRSLGGLGVRKLLQLIRYPIEAAAGAVGGALVSSWEGRAHPHAVRRVTPSGFSDGPVPGPDDWRALSGQPTLLFVHGTFSSAVNGFADVARDADLLTGLLRRYEGRVLAFDHPTLHVGPEDNARWLLEQVPDDVDLWLDVVCHSRGGLVSRALSVKEVADLAGRRAPRVRTLVHVAAPNAGTALADVERWGTLLDTMTNLALLLPSDPASVPLTAILQTVKHLGTGIVSGLPGLGAMSPGSEVLTRLAAAGSADQCAEHQHTVASDFAPEVAPLPLRALDLLVDRFFAEGNDLVVPVAGVSHLTGLGPDDVVRVPATPAVSHVTYFAQQEVRDRISGWLPGSAA